MAMLTVRGTVRRPEGIQDAFVMLQLQVPCFGGHRIAAVTLMRPDGKFVFPAVDTERFDSVEAQPAIFVHATVATKVGSITALSHGKVFDESSKFETEVTIDVNLPAGVGLVSFAEGSAANNASAGMDSTQEQSLLSQDPGQTGLIESPARSNTMFGVSIEMGTLLAGLRQAKRGEFDKMVSPGVLASLDRVGAVRNGRIDWTLADKEGLASPEVAMLLASLSDNLRG